MAEGEPSTLLTASDSYEAWKGGDPAYSQEQVTEIYVSAEKNARSMDSKFGTKFARNPVTMTRLTELGISPDTLEPSQPQKK